MAIQLIPGLVAAGEAFDPIILRKDPDTDRVVWVGPRCKTAEHAIHAAKVRINMGREPISSEIIRVAFARLLGQIQQAGNVLAITSSAAYRDVMALIDAENGTWVDRT